MKELVKKAKKVLRECDDVLDINSGNWSGRWLDVRSITREFIDLIPKEILEVIELNERAQKNLESYEEAW